MATAPARPPASTGGALVLAGGGVAGIAWELGVLRGIADADPVLADRILGADLIVGTSAGASVAAQITSGVALDDLYRAQLSPGSAEIDVPVDMESLYADYGAAMAGASGPEDAGRRMGAMALAAATVEPAVRLAVIDARLPVKQWPDRHLRLTSVDAETGEVAVFTRESCSTPSPPAPRYPASGRPSRSATAVTSTAACAPRPTPTSPRGPIVCWSSSRYSRARRSRGAASTPSSPPWPRPPST
jgi:hypothetical protein